MILVLSRHLLSVVQPDGLLISASDLEVIGRLRHLLQLLYSRQVRQHQFVVQFRRILIDISRTGLWHAYLTTLGCLPLGYCGAPHQTR